MILLFTFCEGVYFSLFYLAFYLDVRIFAVWKIR